MLRSILKIPMRSKICLLFTLATIAENGFPIGRIGNNLTINDKAEAYSAQIPEPFRTVTSIEDGGYRIESGLFFSSATQPLDIEVLSFRSQYPRLTGKSVVDVEKNLKASRQVRYQKIETGNQTLALFGESDSSVQAIAVCGDGRGYIMFAPKVAITAEAMEQILKSTVFTTPCQY